MKKGQFLTHIFLFDFLLDYNRGISVVCSNFLKNTFLEVITKFISKRVFFTDDNFLIPTESSVAIGCPPRS
jgi:hypothetical protein